MKDDIYALAELQHLLPLQQRQQALPARLRHLHQSILRELYQHPRILTATDIETLTEEDPYHALRSLAENDLIVTDKHHAQIFGVYPFSLQPTPFRLKLHEYWTYAMCALDAIAVAPLFDAEVEVHAVCNISGVNVFIHQQGRRVLSSIPPMSVDDGLQVGIHWQPAGDCAARSLCRDIVFLQDHAAALKWQQGVDDKTSILGLNDAIELGAAFFCPILD